MGMGREFEGLELVPFEFLVMSNSSVRPTIAETMIREAPIPIEEVVLTGRAMPPSPPGFWEKIGNWFDSVFDSSSESTAPRTMDKTVENVKPEGSSELIKPETLARAERLNKVDRSGKDFTKAGKEVVKEINKQKNEGKNICEGCKQETIPSKKSEPGVKPPGNETQIDHIVPKSKGGRGNPDNGQVLCRSCNRAKSNH